MECKIVIILCLRICRQIKFFISAEVCNIHVLRHMFIDHIALAITRKVNFLVFALMMMTVLCLENCSFYPLDWYEEMLAFPRYDIRGKF